MMRATKCVLILLSLVLESWAYEIPSATFEVYSQGFQAFVPHENGIEYVLLNWKLNSENNWSDGSTSWVMFNHFDRTEHWVYTDYDAVLQQDDVLHYSIFVSKDQENYVKYNLIHIVKNYAGIMIENPDVFTLEENSHYRIPAPRIIIYHKGFKVFLPHVTGMQAVTFAANCNRTIGYPNLGTWSGEFTQSNNRWTYRNFDAQLQPGDTLKYWISVQKIDNLYIKPNGVYTVKSCGVILSEASGGPDLDDTAQYIISSLIFRVYRTGFEVYIPHEIGIEYVLFSWKLNSKVNCTAERDCWFMFDESDEGDFWVYTDFDAELQLQDIVYYSIFVVKNGKEFIKNNLIHVVENYEDTTAEELGTATTDENSHYIIPEPSITVNRKGFEFSIPHKTGIQMVAFGANRNLNIVYPNSGTWSGEFIYSNESNRWIYTNFVAQLQLGDNLKYWISVEKNDDIYVAQNCVYSVEKYIANK